MEDNEIKILYQIVTGRSVPPKPENFVSDEAAAMYNDLVAIRSILTSFADGKFDSDITIRGSLVSYLKTLQANFRHLAWQVRQVADGDFTQRVDFMGTFADSFNTMVEKFQRMVSQLTEREVKLTKLANDLAANRERWNLAVQCSRDGIWDIDVLNKTAWYSDNFMQMMHYTPNNLPRDLRWDLLVHSDDRDQADTLHQILWRRDSITPFSLEFRLKNGKGDYLWVRLRGMPIHNESNEDSSLYQSGISVSSNVRMVSVKTPKTHRLIAVCSDISSQKEVEHSLARQAMHDHLTGLPNRYLLNDRMRQYVAHANRTSTPFILGACDLDNFKGVNDTFGHAGGDQVLVEYARVLQMGLRNMDTVARIGGDEFFMVFPCAAGMEEATVTQVMKRFFSNLAVPVNVNGTSYTIHSSVGVAFFPRHATDLVELFEKSDAALYKAKKAGKNQYAVWSPDENS